MAMVVGADAGGIGETRLAILQFTSKPKLADKHMARPPFAFIHAVIKNIILNTGYQKMLFMKEELNASSIKSKADKVAWLQKVKDAGVCWLSRRDPLLELCRIWNTFARTHNLPFVLQ